MRRAEPHGAELQTFCLWVRRRPAFERTLKRQGQRAAYAHAGIYLELNRTTPRHGDRPFEICHIDHTELDVELGSATKLNLKTRNGVLWARTEANLITAQALRGVNDSGHRTRIATKEGNCYFEDRQ